MWILNLGDHAVVTCGPTPLAQDFVKSITVVPEDIKTLATGTQQAADKLTRIRLLDFDGRVLLYTLTECETYFEMEQKVRETSLAPIVTKPSLIYRNENEKDQTVDPAGWPTLLGSPNRLFIDLTASKDCTSTEEEEQPISKGKVTKNAIPPFFHWPQPEKKDQKTEGSTNNPSSSKLLNN